MWDLCLGLLAFLGVIKVHILQYVYLFSYSLGPEAEFLDVIIGQKSTEFSSLPFTVTSTNEFYSPHPPPPEQKWFETGL